MSSTPTILENRINVGAVSYLNTRPLLYGIENSILANNLCLTLDYPARLAKLLATGGIDIALLPVAAIPEIPGARIVGDYGIATEGNVVSVALFSKVPLQEIKDVFLDYQSRTSVRLAQLLFTHYWKIPVNYMPSSEGYIDQIGETTAGVIIGDRALEQLHNFEFVYDLSAAWKSFSGLDFVFAAWVTNKDLPETFLKAFNAANEWGVKQIDAVIQTIDYPAYDLNVYYKENIIYKLDANKLAGLNKFLSLL